MATLPVDETRIIERFGPHLSTMEGVRLATGSNRIGSCARTAVSAGSSAAYT
jgi:hypothetical protein